MNQYQESIVDYYSQTENSYKDAWDLDNTFSLHHGYWDYTVNSFSDSLLRMNAVLAGKAAIQKNMHVLDAGCGIGGSSVWLAKNIGCRVTGITLSQKQAEQAQALAQRFGLTHLLTFQVADYCHTHFENESFDVVWAIESVCYAESKAEFAKEAFRVLKPKGTFIMADAMVEAFENNQHTTIRTLLDGMLVNYLETPENWTQFCAEAGFKISCLDNISSYAQKTSTRLFYFSIVAKVWAWYRQHIVRKPFTDVQVNNIKASGAQYWGLKKKLWQYQILHSVK